MKSFYTIFSHSKWFILILDYLKGKTWITNMLSLFEAFLLSNKQLKTPNVMWLIATIRLNHKGFFFANFDFQRQLVLLLKKHVSKVSNIKSANFKCNLKKGKCYSYLITCKNKLHLHLRSICSERMTVVTCLLSLLPCVFIRYCLFWLKLALGFQIYELLIVRKKNDFTHVWIWQIRHI